MIPEEALKKIQEIAKEFQLVIGSIGFDENGNLEKVYLFKSRAKARTFSHSPYTGGEAYANIIPRSYVWELGKVKSYCLQYDLT